MTVEAGSRHIVITGATGGVGKALTLALARADWKVSAIGRNRALLDELDNLGSNVAAFAANVADGPECEAAFGQAAARFGAPTHLVAAAAVYPKMHFLDQAPEHLQEVLNINVVGVANSVRAVLPAMLEQNYGRVVIVGSLADMNPGPGSLAYCVSKGALHTLTRGIAREIDRDRYPNVLVNEFSPGATRTAMSTYGNAPEDIPPMLMPLLECDANGPHGRFFQEWREIRVGESWKGAIKRILLRKG